METSRITSKHQATVPSDVRAALRLKAGDTLAWEVGADIVTVRKARALDIAFAAALNGTLEEWDSPEDEVAWRDL